MIQSAHTLCREIENLDLKNTQPLVSALIRLLYAANNLAQSPINAEDYDLGTCVILPDALNRIPDNMIFQVVFDPLDPQSICATSLRDPLADIYKPLALGLQAIDNEKQKELAVLLEWSQGYKYHWGRHLIDVIRYFLLCPGIEKAGQ